MILQLVAVLAEAFFLYIVAFVDESVIFCIALSETVIVIAPDAAPSFLSNALATILYLPAFAFLATFTLPFDTVTP